MDISDIPIIGTGELPEITRYLLFRVSDHNQAIYFLRFGKDENYVHRWIYDQLNYELLKELSSYFPELSIEPLGGGFIATDKERKKIKLIDESGDYGREPREKTKELLEQAFPGFSIEICD